ncbi:MAG TPA: Gfo/Idh/MocA family oxidoreductase [Actinomycetota bacterium]
MTDRPRDPITVALIGYGLAGAVFHGPLVSSTPGMSLATIVTGDPGRRARASSKHPDAVLLDDVEALWERAADHDLVVVATPNRSHVPLALAALEAGLPVVIDKPVAPTAAEGRRLVAEAAERDLLLTVFQNRRWDGDFLTVRRLLSEDALGPIVRFESRFERWRPRVSEGVWRERGDPQEAGGLLFDLGSHLIDQAVVAFGPPRTVYAEVDRRRPHAEVDDDVFIALEHGSGVRSHLWMSVLAAIRGPRIRLLGLRAAFEKFGLDVQEQALSEGALPDDPAYGREPPERWGRLSNGEDERTIETEPGAYQEFYRGVAASLREGTPPPVDPHDSVMGLEIIEAAQESARTERVIAVG